MDNSNSDSIEQHLQKAREFKARNDIEGALTEYRRAALADSNSFEAQLGIGLLCKTKIQLDPYYNRHAFEAFRKAARLDLTHQQAHDDYILFAQKLGLLDELLKEYDGWIVKNPDNELLKRCRKNIVTISMAMMPEQVSMASSGPSSLIKKTTLIVSLGAIAMAFVMIFVVPMVKKKVGGGTQKSEMRNIFIVGTMFGLAGMAGLIGFSKIK